MGTLKSVILAGCFFAGTAFAQSDQKLQEELKACDGAVEIPIKVSGTPAEGKLMHYGTASKQPLTVRLGLKRSQKRAALSVWVNNALQFVVDGDELQSFGNDGFGIRLAFAASAPSQEEQPKIFRNGELRLALPQAKTNEVTFMVSAMDGEIRTCGSHSDKYTTGTIDTYALVLGFNYSGAGGGRELKYASLDAKAITHHLINSAGVKPINIWLLTDDLAMSSKVPEGVKVVAVETPNTVRLKLNTIISEADPSSRLYVYYSGHMLLPQGLPALYGYGVAFFLPRSNEEDPGTLLTRREVLIRLFHAGFASTAVILDACFSGSTTVSYGDGVTTSPGALGAKSWRLAGVGRDPREGLDPDFAGANIASSDGVAPSWELDELKHSVFTYYLLNAGRDKASLSLQDAVSEAETEMAQLQPKGWPDKLKQQPTSRFTNGLNIPWKRQQP